MLNLDPEEVRRGLAEQADRAIVSLTSRDGRPVLLTRAVAEWFVSGALRPRQEDLDRVLDGATRVRVLVRNTVRGDRSREASEDTVHADVSDPTALEELRSCLRILDTGGHMLCPTDLALEVHGPEGSRALIGVIDIALLRWRDRWKTDAQLVAPEALGEWIARHGSAEPLRASRERAEQARRAQEAERRARASWEAAMPPCLRPVWRQIVSEEAERMGADHQADLAPGITALCSASTDRERTIADLLAWAGTCSSPAGRTGADLVVFRLLREFASDDDLVRCLAAGPGDRAIEGAAALLTWLPHARAVTPGGVRARRRARREVADLERRLRLACPAFDARLARR